MEEEDAAEAGEDGADPAEEAAADPETAEEAAESVAEGEEAGAEESSASEKDPAEEKKASADADFEEAEGKAGNFAAAEEAAADLIMTEGAAEKPLEGEPAAAEPAEETTGIPITFLSISIFNPVCMETADPDDPDHEYGGAYCYISEDDELEISLAEVELCDWAESCSGDSYKPYTGLFTGDEIYRIYAELTPVEEYYFDESLSFKVSDDLYDVDDSSTLRLLHLQRDRAAVEISVPAVHRWATSDGTWIRKPTCQEAGEISYYCENNPSHTTTEIVEDPDAHEWGEWVITEEATTTKEGARHHTCTLCGTQVSEVIPKITIPYTKVYEPETSWSMSATVAWRADENAVAAADPSASVRPATLFVWLDADLKVYDRNGKLLSENLESYVKNTCAGAIPAFYIQDGETAAALKEAIVQIGLQDCFVVSAGENRELIRDVADLLHVRGMLDFTSVSSPDRKKLAEMIAAVNGAHGKVLLLSLEAATRETIRTLQSLAATVWVQVPADADTKLLVTLYTNGVDGVLVDDYEKAISAEELFQDDAASLLRVPLVIGHRGDPSTYVENTLDSAIGAYEEGVDSVENDIHLTTDGRLVIYHNDIYGSLTDIPYDERKEIEACSLEELLKLPFSWDKIPDQNEVPVDDSRYGTLYGQEEEKEYTVPTLDEYLERFLNTGLVHDTEIKSRNTEILPVLKGLVDSLDAWDQIFCITFEQIIMEAIYSKYPEISIGALTVGPYFTDEAVEAYLKLEDKDDTEALLAILYSQLDRWNATYNPIYVNYGENIINAGRHRGLTVWPWTYTYGEEFARDYMLGVRGMTMDYPWITSDYIVEISSPGDVTVESLSEIEKPFGTTQGGTRKELADAELVTLEKLSDTETLRIWRYRAQMDVMGEDYGHYYLYSNPFIVTVAEHVHVWSEPSYTWSKDYSTVRAVRICSTCGVTETETVKTTAETVQEAADGKDGEIRYTAVFENPAFQRRQKQ